MATLTQYRTHASLYGDAPLVNRWAEEHAESHAESVYKAFAGTVTLTL